MDYHLLLKKAVICEAPTFAQAVVLRWDHFIQTGQWLRIKEVVYAVKM